jgi:8-oxo-dGTP diphosphatase
MTANGALLVVAAVLERDGLILAGQRKRTAKHALQWEFPGGKVEPGEDPRAALARELAEELGIQAVIGAQVEVHDFQYPDQARITRLLFYRVTEFTGEPENLEFEQIRWVTPSALVDLDFLEGDVAFVRRLALGQGR